MDLKGILILKGEVERGLRSAIDLSKPKRTGAGRLRARETDRDRSRKRAPRSGASARSRPFGVPARTRRRSADRVAVDRGRNVGRGEGARTSSQEIFHKSEINLVCRCDPGRTGGRGVRRRLHVTPTPGTCDGRVSRNPVRSAPTLGEVARVNVDARGPSKETNPFGARSVARANRASIFGARAVSGVLASPCPETARPQ